MQLKLHSSSWSVLAGARFLLSLIVLISHLAWFSPLPPVLGPFYQFGGKAAVVGFLIISGISIGHSYEKESASYFKRRFLRIYPLYFVAVIFTQVVTLAVGPFFSTPNFSLNASGWPTFVSNLFFFQGLFTTTIAFNGPLWSLGAEVFYYTLVPLLVKLRTWMILLLVVLSMIAFAFFPEGWYFEYVAFRYAWAWLIGYLLVTRKLNNLLIGALLLSSTLLIFYNKTDTVQSLSWLTYALTIVAIALAVLLYLPKIVQSVLIFLGDLSYPLYLFHLPLFIFFHHFFNLNNTYYYIYFVFICSAIANVVFDTWLKRIVWKPLVTYFSSRVRITSPYSRT